MSLPAGEAAQLEAHLPMLLAEQTLREKGGSLTPESLMSVMLAAGATQDEAEKAYCDAVFRQERG